MVVVASGIEIWTMALGVPGHRVVSKMAAVGSPMLVSQSGGALAATSRVRCSPTCRRNGAVPLSAAALTQSARPCSWAATEFDLTSSRHPKVSSERYAHAHDQGDYQAPKEGQAHQNRWPRHPAGAQTSRPYGPQPGYRRGHQDQGQQENSLPRREGLERGRVSIATVSAKFPHSPSDIFLCPRSNRDRRLACLRRTQKQPHNHHHDALPRPKPQERLLVAARADYVGDGYDGQSGSCTEARCREAGGQTAAVREPLECIAYRGSVYDTGANPTDGCADIEEHQRIGD